MPRPGSPPHTRGIPDEAKRYPARRVHPRIRGEYLYAVTCIISVRGFTPAYAGNTPENLRRAAVPSRFTPAYAGNTGSLMDGRICAYPWVHPRIRGEYLSKCSHPLVHPRIRGEYLYSSGIQVHPRIRGEYDETTIRDSPRGGFTPAYAGNTEGMPPYALFRGSPPHTRGIPVLTPAGLPLAGSPPHTRGIPFRRDPETRLHQVHPRIRGEYRHRMIGWNVHPWVHPRIRGEYRERRFRIHGGTGRFTPAYAGNTHASWVRHHALDQGFTPAYAGNTMKADPPISRDDVRVHPRIRGEYR